MSMLVNPFRGGFGGVPFSAVVLLVGFEGADASTTFTDESSYARTLSANGNAQVDTAQFKYGAASGLFDGTGDFVSAAHATELSVPGSGDVCLEAFIRLSATGRIHTILDKRASSGSTEYSFQVTAANVLQFALFNSVSGVVGLAVGATALTTGVWYHVAGVRYLNAGTNNIYVFLDGVLDGSGVQTIAATANTNALNIGRSLFNTARDMQGWIDEVRVTTGHARYTANFTPPATLFPRS